MIAVAVAVPVGLSVHRELRATANAESRGGVRAATATYRQEKCIYRAVRRELPEGAIIYIGQPLASSDAARVVELSTTWAVPEATPATAGWTVTLVPKPGICLGLALEVHRR